jgi:uncharacterized repeat protein (TIGR03803 family)
VSALVAAQLTVLDPFIVSQPLSQSADGGGTVSFSVIAGGTAPLRYQWLKSDTPIHDGPKISGTQAASLTLSDLSREDTAGYSVIVSNEIGVVSSIVANLVVSPFRILHSFAGGDDGEGPFAGLVESGGVLFGTTCYGGTENFGTVFRVNTDGTDFTVLHRFNGFDGANPHGGLVVSGTTLYGTTEEGGSHYIPNISNGNGTVFCLNNDGTQFRVIKSFTGFADGDRPEAGLVLSGSTLYGTTVSGGTSIWDQGMVFSVNTDGTGFRLLHSFDGLQGALPWGGMVLGGDTLYGSVRANGIVETNGYVSDVGNGVVFKLNTNGTDYALLHDFSGSTISQPSGDLSLFGNILYGATMSGAIYRLNTDGSVFRILKLSTVADGLGMPLGGLALAGHTLFGTTTIVAPPAANSVFELGTDGHGFRIVRTFAADEVNNIQAGLVLSGTNLYGTAFYGGQSNRGVVFRLSVPIPIILNVPMSQTAELGGKASFQVHAAGEPPLNYRWFVNDSTAVSDFGTNATLTLTNLQPAQAGTYTVIISNAFDSVTSAPVVLSLIPRVERRSVPGLILAGQSGTVLNLETSDRLESKFNWALLDSFVLTGDTQWYFDVATPLPAQHFYRAWQAGRFTTIPALDLHLVPALTLTGPIGTALRVDGINQFGPTDAWFPLATVTLTNTSQLFFDTSVIGQPPRLWRIAPVP